MRRSSPDEVVRMDDHLVGGRGRRRWRQLMLQPVRVILHVASDIGVDARVVVHVHVSRPRGGQTSFFSLDNQLGENKRHSCLELVDCLSTPEIHAHCHRTRLKTKLKPFVQSHQGSCHAKIFKVPTVL